MNNSNTFRLVRMAVAALFISGAAIGSAQAANESNWIFPNFGPSASTTEPVGANAQGSKGPEGKVMVEAPAQQPESWTRS